MPTLTDTSPQTAGTRTERSPLVRCNCENEQCQSTEHIVSDTEWSHCPRRATVAVDYIGGICATCAEFMPEQFKHGALDANDKQNGTR